MHLKWGWKNRSLQQLIWRTHIVRFDSFEIIYRHYLPFGWSERGGCHHSLERDQRLQRSQAVAALLQLRSCAPGVRLESLAGKSWECEQGASRVSEARTSERRGCTWQVHGRRRRLCCRQGIAVCSQPLVLDRRRCKCCTRRRKVCFKWQKMFTYCICFCGWLLTLVYQWCDFCAVITIFIEVM